MHQFSEDAEALSRFLHDKTPDYDPELDRPNPKLDQAEKRLYDSLPSISSPPNKNLMNLTAREMRELGYPVKSPNPPNPPQSHTHKSKRHRNRNPTKNSKPKTSKQSNVPKRRSTPPKTSKLKTSKASKILKSRSNPPSRVIKRAS
ncbi:hypothetical protein TWF506_005453 [Arthrobotrys conoides]|uniref:Uncharacterized protein n=1 Tax=Arthrobotrys conoides TaxID=74498 RepID=A0AAN8RPW4_9PEZI